MTIAFYSDLKAAVASFLNRSDLTSNIPDFIALAESRFRRELRGWLRTYDEPVNIDSNPYGVSAFVDEVLSVALNDGPGGQYNHPLTIVTREQYQLLMARDSSVRKPVTHVFVDRVEISGATSLHFYPPVSVASPIAKLRLEVVQLLTALSDSLPDNRLLQVAPDVYLYGALAEAAPFLQHDERLALFEARADAGIKALVQQTERRMHGASPHRATRLPVVFG